MTEQAYTATVKAHQQRQQVIYDELQRLIDEAKEITQQLAQLQADRMNTQRTKGTVQDG